MREVNDTGEDEVLKALGKIESGKSSKFDGSSVKFFEKGRIIMV